MAGVLLIVLACFLWALDALIRYPLVGKGLGSLDLVFVEHSLLFVLSFYVFIKTIPKIKLNGFKSIFYFFIVGGIGSALATLAFTRAFMFLNPSLVIILQKFQPIVAILLARFFLKEQFGKAFVGWAAISIVGAVLISLTDIIGAMSLISTNGDSITSMFMHEGALQGYFLVFISVLGWGAATVFGKKISNMGFNEKEIMSTRFTFGFLTLLPFISFMDFRSQILSDSIYQIVAMVLLSGILAMYLYYVGLKKISARACSLAELFFPFCAVIVNWIFLDARL
ncbi:MAG: drug/metabolite transporter (DMT)-like permease, partial [Thermoproteota archaeon]